MATTSIPSRAVFRAQEVCEMAGVQLYVLKSWEAEFPDLGISKTAGGPRVYRRSDVDRVLRLKKLVFEEGLTLAGARKQLGLTPPAPAEDAPVTDADVAELLDREMRASLLDVRRGLQWVLGVLSGDGITAEDRVLAAPRPGERRATAAKSRPARAVKAGKPARTARSRKR